MIIRAILVAVLVSYAVFVWWFIGVIELSGHQITKAYEEISKPAPTPVAIVRFDNARQGLVVPAWQWITEGRIWSVVSAKSPISTDFIPKLTNISVTKASWMYENQIHPEVNIALKRLFARAKEVGQPLIVTSAYRSAVDQQKLYTSSTATYGSGWVVSHVAKPGQSEHQTGLVVDLSSHTASCLQAFAGCHLRSDTVSRLANNAADFGFILRYSPNKSHITGISHEYWHYRYVGERMAKLIRDSGLTLDEVIRQLRAHRDSTR